MPTIARTRRRIWPGLRGRRFWERQDLELRGKGHALAWGIAKLRRELRPALNDAVVIIDADIVADPNLLWAFAAQLQQGRSFIQAFYTGANPDVSWRTQLLSYALTLINGVWLMGQQQLGMSVGLRGNGMAFTIAGLKRQPWSDFGLAEDLEHSWRLRLGGERVHFARAAKIAAQLVSQGGEAAVSQRQRWEHGRRLIRESFRPRILAATGLSKWAKLYYLLDLYMQPLAKMAAWQLIALGLAAAAGFSGAPPIVVGLLLAVQIFGLACLALYAATPFMLPKAAATLSPSLTLFARLCAVAKLKLFGQKAPKQWVRTGRE